MGKINVLERFRNYFDYNTYWNSSQKTDYFEQRMFGLVFSGIEKRVCEKLLCLNVFVIISTCRVLSLKNVQCKHGIYL